MSPAGGARAAPSLLLSLLLGASAPLWLRAEKLGESGGRGQPGEVAPLLGAGSCPRPGERVRGVRRGSVGCAQLTRLIPAAFIPAPRSCEITAVTGLRESVSSRSPRPPLVGGCSSWVPSALLFPKSRQRGKVRGKLEARRLRPRGRPGSAPALLRRWGWDGMRMRMGMEMMMGMGLLQGSEPIPGTGSPRPAARAAHLQPRREEQRLLRPRQSLVGISLGSRSLVKRGPGSCSVCPMFVYGSQLSFPCELRIQLAFAAGQLRAAGCGIARPGASILEEFTDSYHRSCAGS